MQTTIDGAMNNALFRVNLLLLCAVNGAFAIAGILLNSVVIKSLLGSELRRKICYFTILLLACFDLATIVFAHPLFTYKAVVLNSDIQQNRRGIFQVKRQIFTFSLTAFLTMTIERYLALAFTFFHERYITRRRIITFFCSCRYYPHRTI